MKGAVVVDAELHELCIAVAVEAAGQVSAGAVRLADDLDRVDRLVADGDIDTVDEEVTAGQHLVDIGADDGKL